MTSKASFHSSMGIWTLRQIKHTTREILNRKACTIENCLHFYFNYVVRTLYSIFIAVVGVRAYLSVCLCACTWYKSTISKWHQWQWKYHLVSYRYSIWRWWLQWITCIVQTVNRNLCNINSYTYNIPCITLTCS